MIVVSFFAWCEFKFFVERVLVSVDIFVDIVQVDIIFDFIDDEGDSPEGFIEVVVVPDVTDGVEEPGKEDFGFFEIVDFFDCLLYFFKVGFFAFFLEESWDFFIKSVESLADEILHAILIEGRDTVVEEEDKEGNNTTDKSKKFASTWVVKRIMIENAIIVEGDVSGKLIWQIIGIPPFLFFVGLIVVGLPASRVVLARVDEFGEGDVAFEGVWYEVGFEVVLYHLVLEVLGEDVLARGWHVVRSQVDPPKTVQERTPGLIFVLVVNVQLEVFFYVVFRDPHQV